MALQQSDIHVVCHNITFYVLCTFITVCVSSQASLSNENVPQTHYNYASILQFVNCRSRFLRFFFIALESLIVQIRSCNAYSDYGFGAAMKLGLLYLYILSNGSCSWSNHSRVMDTLNCLYMQEVFDKLTFKQATRQDFHNLQSHLHIIVANNLAALAS